MEVAIMKVDEIGYAKYGSCNYEGWWNRLCEIWKLQFMKVDEIGYVKYGYVKYVSCKLG